MEQANVQLDLDGKRLMVLMPNKHLGNFLLANSALELIALRYPNNPVIYVIDDYYQEIALSVFAEDKLLFYPRKQLKNAASTWARFAIYRRFIGRLRGFKADYAIDIDGDRSGASLAWLSGARRRIGPAHSKRKVFFNDIYASRRPNTHRATDYNNMATYIGAKNQYPYYLKPQAADISIVKLQALLDADGVSQHDKVACIHPGASLDYKRWPASHFADVGRWLDANGYRVILIGAGAADMTQADYVAANVGTQKVINLCNKLSIGDLVALYERSDVYLGNDSGPMHLASACRARVFVLYGPTREEKWGPISDTATVIRHPETCLSSCNTEYCSEGHRCLRTLSPEWVIDVISNSVIVEPPSCAVNHL